MKLTKHFILASFLILLLSSVPALAQQPNFGPALYGDGELWGTKATTVLPAPRGNNLHSFDKLFLVVLEVDHEFVLVQMPVSEAAPTNPDYNGGRWITHVASWTEAGVDAHGLPLPTLTSYDDIMLHYSLGHLEITQGSIPGGPPLYFQCPLLPVK